MPEPEPEDDETDDETETVTDLDAKLAAMQTKMMADFEKKTAKTIEKAVAKALEPRVLALADKSATPKAKTKGRPRKVGTSPATGRPRKEPERFTAGPR